MSGTLPGQNLRSAGPGENFPGKTPGFLLADVIHIVDIRRPGICGLFGRHNFMDAFVNHYNRSWTPNTIDTGRWLSVDWDMLDPGQMKVRFNVF